MAGGGFLEGRVGGDERGALEGGLRGGFEAVELRLHAVDGGLQGGVGGGVLDGGLS